MIILKNVLVVSDFSEPSHAAFEEGLALAAAFNAKLHLLHVVEEPLHEAWAAYATGANFLDLIDDLQADARKRLEDIAAQTGGVHVVVATSWGAPAGEILKYAKKHAVDLIVCGTHGRSGWKHLLLGSVAERIVRLAPCPVLTVHSLRGRAQAAA